MNRNQLRPSRRLGALTAAGLIGLTACATPAKPGPEPLPLAASPLRPPPLGPAGVASPRIDGRIGTPEAPPPSQLSLAPERGVQVPPPPDPRAGHGEVSLDFADTDIREVAAQILGKVLQVNYTIDPAVRGTATLRTATPLPRSRLLPMLQALLAQNGAALVHSGGLYRVLPASAASALPVLASATPAGDGATGISVVPLRFAGAEDLATTLQPFIRASGSIAADAGRNALIISGDPATRETLASLVRAFDIDVLAGQSYALLPVAPGDARDFAAALQEAFRSQAGGALASLLRVVPMHRVDAVLVVASQPRLIDEARRIHAMVERTRRETVRNWHVFYLQNSQSNDIAHVLQQAFTPGSITVQPSAPGGGPGATAPGLRPRQLGGMGGAGLGGGVGGAAGGSGLGLPGGLGGGLSGLAGFAVQGIAAAGQPPGTSPAAGAASPASAPNPLLGGLEGLGPLSGGNAAGAGEASMRIIPNPSNNALLVYATPRERETVEAMLRRVDILPLQVRIDAVIAEVTLNDALQYGTQFFFKSGGINGILSLAAFASPAAPFANTFPGFVLSGDGGNSWAISMLQNVTTVRVLSSPQLLVLDNQPARLQVGNLVPYLTQTSQSTLVGGAPVINSIAYRGTGVIMEVVPRVNSGGLVTLDISQEVSDVDPNPPTTPGINSPTFLERSVQSRIVVQDGQTVGLAGLIRDTSSRGNEGIPILKDIPVLGFLAGTQNNSRTRTELLVLITPRVIHDQRDARALTEDLRQQLPRAAGVPQELQHLGPSGSADPGIRLRQRIGLEN